MLWRLILKEFGPNIQNIDVVDNIVDDTLSRLTSTSVKNHEPITSKSKSYADYLFAIGK